MATTRQENTSDSHNVVMSEIITSDSHVGIDHQTGFWCFRILTDEVIGHPFLPSVPEDVRDQVKSETHFVHITDMEWMRPEDETDGQFDNCDRNLELASALDNVC